MTVSRSSCGRRLQRSSASSGGSIGAARPGTYVVNARDAAPRSSEEPAGTKADTSAMWTHARYPPSSSRIESASSKSFAVSGSIVNVVSSRRSTRSSMVGDGATYGSKSVRAPTWTSRPSSTASMSFAFPSTRWRRARPRPPPTTARSPGRASRRPFLSTTSGTPGVKYGSPTTSFPRRASSTTISDSAMHKCSRSWRVAGRAQADGRVLQHGPSAGARPATRGARGAGLRPAARAPPRDARVRSSGNGG